MKIDNPMLLLLTFCKVKESPGIHDYIHDIYMTIFCSQNLHNMTAIVINNYDLKLRVYKILNTNHMLSVIKFHMHQVKLQKLINHYIM